MRIFFAADGPLIRVKAPLVGVFSRAGKSHRVRPLSNSTDFDTTNASSSGTKDSQSRCDNA